MKDWQGRIDGLLSRAEGQWGIAIEEILPEGVQREPWRFERRAHEPFTAASVIKVPIMVAAFEAAARGRLRLSQKILLRKEDQVLGSGVLHSLETGRPYSLYDLITLMIIVSDNTATNLVIREVGTSFIQEVMAAYGMTGSRFHNPLMVIPADSPGPNQVTAADMVKLYGAIARGKAVSWDASRRMVEILSAQQFTDGIGGCLPRHEGPVGSLPTWRIATKSGQITGHVHDTGLLFLPGRTLALAFLSRGIHDPLRAKRFIADAVRALYDAHMALAG
ncbi:MAG: class A beta-lactamase-related serine hydrolase [Clostridiales bacterium]|nr:class A beta-lactamase-related serine hydrolase [Clostridiales bacterium]